MTYKLRILSLGAGVQSTTLLLMAERGEIEPFHCAIFADTGWESQATYNHLEWMRWTCRTPIIIVKSDKGSIFDWEMNASFRDSKQFSVIPYYFTMNNKKGISKRQCTTHFKLYPIRKGVRKMLGVGTHDRIPKGAVELIIGISSDESNRIKLSQVQYIENSYPLVYHNMDRNACIKWLMNNYRLTVPKSSCIGCPFHGDKEWREIAGNPIAWKEAVLLDENIRDKGLIKGTSDGKMYLHKSCKPLIDVDLRTPEERGQLIFNFDDAVSLICKEQKLDIMVNGLAEL